MFSLLSSNPPRKRFSWCFMFSLVLWAFFLGCLLFSCVFSQVLGAFLGGIGRRSAVLGPVSVFFWFLSSFLDLLRASAVVGPAGGGFGLFRRPRIMFFRVPMFDNFPRQDACFDDPFFGRESEARDRGLIVAVFVRVSSEGRSRDCRTHSLFKHITFTVARPIKVVFGILCCAVTLSVLLREGCLELGWKHAYF